MCVCCVPQCHVQLPQILALFAEHESDDEFDGMEDEFDRMEDESEGMEDGTIEARELTGVFACKTDGSGQVISS